jgi:hypothetical protein
MAGRSSVHRIRRGGSLLAAGRARFIGIFAACVILIPAVGAQATTGADALNKPPIYKPTTAEGAPYVGGYTLASHGAGIIASTMRTGVNTEGYLQGTISVSQYSNGQPGSFVAELYEYHYLGGSKMETDLWTPDLGSALLGHLFLEPAGKDLTGTLELDAKTIPVTYKPVSGTAAQSAVNSAALTGSTTQTLTANAGIFSTAVVLAESIDPTL